MSIKACNILIGGEAGQGLVTVGNLLAKILARHGYYITVTESYQSRIRGGHNTFAIRVSPQPVAASQDEVDLLIALNAESVELDGGSLSGKGMILTDDAHGVSCDRCLSVPYKQLASARYANIVALGVAASLLGLSHEICSEAVRGTFGKKGAQVVEENLQALAKAFEWSTGKPTPCEGLEKISGAEKRIVMNGNDAIVLGALSAGIKFYSFYPMTPATSIGLMLAANARRMGIVVEQSEDEIAAINMAIGASFAGAPSMVASAGGGFALMVEGVSLAAMTETPIVVVIAQRPAPATGLPTRTEQSDLEFVLHSGHGEFPRAVFAPGTIEECFHLTRKAFEVAEGSQGPAFLLTDQFLADSQRAVKPFDLANLKPVTVGARPDGVKIPYRRFEFTADGISPRLLPGMSEHLVVADSDEHAQDGHITEDLSIRKAMMDKRLAKLKWIRGQVIPPAYTGDDSPELLLVAWGSTFGAAMEAVETMKSRGRKVALLNFSQVWPLVPEQFMGRLKGAKEVVGVEGNATAQFSRLIRRETGFEIARTILRYDGLPITPEYIERELNK